MHRCFVISHGKQYVLKENMMNSLPPSKHSMPDKLALFESKLPENRHFTTLNIDLSYKDMKTGRGIFGNSKGTRDKRGKRT